MVFKGNVCRMYDDDWGMILQSKMFSNRMFKVTANVIIASFFKASTEANVIIYEGNCRLGHLGHKGLQILASKNIVRGLPKLEQTSNIWSDSMKGKKHREVFPRKSSWSASQKLELVHADMCGPIKPGSHSRKRYFITFIDGFCMKTWVLFLNEIGSPNGGRVRRKPSYLEDYVTEEAYFEEFNMTTLA